MRIKSPEHLLNEKFQSKNTMFSATDWHRTRASRRSSSNHTEMLTVWIHGAENKVQQ